MALIFMVGSANARHLEVSRFSFEESSLSGHEGSSVLVEVRRSGSPDRRATVSYGTLPGSARAGADFTTTSGTLVFESGETMRSFTIPLIEDGATEPAEHFHVFLHHASRPGILARPWFARVEITVAPPLPSLCAGDVAWSFPSPGGYAQSAAEIADGSIWLTGSQASGALVRLFPSGEADASFAPESGVKFWTILALPSGNAVLTGARFPAGPWDPVPFLAVADSAGKFIREIADRDGAISGGTTFLGVFPDGTFLRSTYVAASGQFRYDRLDENLQLLHSFDYGSALAVPGVGTVNIYAIAAMPDGSVIASRRFSPAENEFHLIRISPDGVLDVSFQSPVRGFISAILPLPNGQFLVGGAMNIGGRYVRMARLNPGGSHDAGFALDPKLLSDLLISPAALDREGRILTLSEEASHTR